MESPKEKEEFTEFSPKVRIYLMRHGDKPTNVGGPELDDIIEDEKKLRIWHKKRHDLGFGPRLPKSSWVDIGQSVINDNALSLRGIIESHDFAHKKDFIGEVLDDFPKGDIRILFYNTRAHRTAETNQIIAEELSYELEQRRKDAKESADVDALKNLNRITIEKPGINGIENTDLGESAGEKKETSVTDIDHFVTSLQEEAINNNTNLMVVATTHAHKIENYIEGKTGRREKIGTTDSFVIEN